MREEAGGVDRVHAAVSGHAHLCLGRLLGTGAQPRPEAAACAKAGWSVLLLASAAPAGDGVPGLSPCERDCLRLLSGDPCRRLKADAVRDALETTRVAVHGLRSVQRALARLVDLRLAEPSRGGYALAGHTPLFAFTPPRDADADAVRSAVSAQAGACLSDLLACGATPRPDIASCGDCGWSVTLLAYAPPASAPGPELSDCEAACLQALRASPQHRLTAEALCGRLAAGTYPASLRTVQRALARLIDVGFVASSTRGYTLRGNDPLFALPRAG